MRRLVARQERLPRPARSLRRHPRVAVARRARHTRASLTSALVHDLFVFVMVTSTVSIALVAGATLYARWWLRKQLRVRLTTRSVAPTSWLVSTSEPARLHRRLRRTTAVARTAGARGDATITEMAAEIEDHAVALETHLVMLQRVWRRERDARRQLCEQIAQLEQLSSRLTTSALEATRLRTLGAGSPDALAELTDRINALDAARIELAALEQSWKL